MRTSAQVLPSFIRASVVASLFFAGTAMADTSQDTPADPAVASPSTPDAQPSAQPGAKKPEAPPTKLEVPTGTFEFGSYGRAHFASDLRGGTGRKANIVAHGPRIDEDDYAELELRREDTFKDGIKSRLVATLALFGPFFHYTGKVGDQLAVRNLYAQGTYKGVNIWAGYRMYRGDDIYLLNWWPLDNQNTLGGGVGGKVYSSGEREGGLPAVHETSLAVHVGQQRLANDFQYQTVPVVNPYGFGSTDILKLDRPRTIETLKLTHLFRPGEKGGYKVVLYGEAHELAAGVQRDPLTDKDRGLPADTGWLVGSQLTYFTGEQDTYVSLVLRHARGVAAYDPLAVPQTFANDRTTSGSSETTIAASGNYQNGIFGLTFGSYARFFRDGGPSAISTQKYDEGVVVARPQLYFAEHFGVGLDASHQVRRIAVIDPATDAPLVAQATRLALIPYFSPSGKGSFKRPQIYAIYALTARDAGARALYPSDDVFAQRKLEHYAGLGAEWWFNSSSYP